jgi:hypothetical protein
MNEQELLFEKISCETNSGYWKVDSKCFFSKIECLQYASKIKNHKVSYHLFDSAYESLDWAAEPKYSIEELYKQRAWQIREKYKRVVLAFSGGADSATVLDTFINNGIPVDEIVSYYPIRAIEKLLPSFDPNNRQAANGIFEYTMAAEPKLKWIAQHHPEIKITIIDPTDYIENLILSDNPEQFVEYGTSLTVYNGGRVQLCKILKEYNDIYGSVCVVFGIDKPALRFDPVTKRIGVCVDDFSHKQCKLVVDGYSPNVEPFYNTPDMPEIMHAQGKVLSKMLVPALSGEKVSHMVDLLGADFNVEKLIKPSHFKNPFLNINQHSDIVKRIIYKTWNLNTWQVSVKPHQHFNLDFEFDGWFHKTDFFDKRTKDYFVGQHHDWLTGIDDYFFRRKDNGTVFAFIPYVSKIYWC